jgi:integration host factor subunit alpha
MPRKPIKTLTRNDLMMVLTTKLGITPKQAFSLIEDFMKASVHGLKKKGILKLSGFGTFTVLQKTQRIGRNPRTSEKAIVSARKVVSFHPSTPLKNKVNTALKNRE